jgi:hypothetical protein
LGWLNPQVPYSFFREVFQHDAVIAANLNYEWVDLFRQQGLNLNSCLGKMLPHPRGSGGEISIVIVILDRWINRFSKLDHRAIRAEGNLEVVEKLDLELILSKKTVGNWHLAKIQYQLR